MGNVICGILATILLFMWVDQSIEISSFSVYAAIFHFLFGLTALGCVIAASIHDIFL